MGSSGELNFVMHWLNNKELHYTVEAEHLMQLMAQQAPGGGGGGAGLG
jgi:hypothetical protein